jgi:transcriptional regulator with XRE-family HTH domain
VEVREVRELRQAKSWTQGELAKRLQAAGFKLHQSSVARMEVAERPTSVGEVAALARIFSVPIWSMFESPSDRANPRVRFGQVKARMDEIDEELGQMGDRADILTLERGRAVRSVGRDQRGTGEGPGDP